VFLEAWRRRQSIEITGTSMLPWLLGTANNVARNSRRSLRRYRAALHRLPVDRHAASAEDDALERLELERALSDAVRALDRLSEAERDVVNLVLWGGVSYEDAARALRVPIGTIRSRLARARKKLARGQGEPVDEAGPPTIDSPDQTTRPT
jgi:RNA polymerase sigma-70 factor (ECF subfamily)